MIELALIGLEKAINGYCRLDQNTIDRLQSLEGKVIQCDITDWGAHLYILPHDHGMRLTKDHTGSVDTTISGTLNGLMRVGCQKGSSTAATKNNVSITGNMQVAQSMQEILGKIDIDWEEHLSKLMGDSIAHQIGWRTRQVVSAGKGIADSFKQSLTEFLHHESRSVPTQKECDAFCQDVTHVKNDVERVEARINQLKQKMKHD
ncbi:MAG: SCP2 sterol-binding domain-containing protein [Gammaproteobacteria bacterium]|nr:SCP2 sterol-binding domain-containing protein [Gammaproteobacteria bacterium]